MGGGEDSNFSGVSLLFSLPFSLFHSPVLPDIFCHLPASLFPHLTP